MRVITFIAALSLVAAVAVACDGDGDRPQPGVGGSPGGPVATEPARPTGVDPAATFVAQQIKLGIIERKANASPVPRDTRLIAEFTCQDDLFLINTNNEFIWASIPCDRVTPLSALDPYRQEAVSISVDPAAGKLRIETVAGAQAEFTVNAVWVYERPR